MLTAGPPGAVAPAAIAKFVEFPTPVKAFLDVAKLLTSVHDVPFHISVFAV